MSFLTDLKFALRSLSRAKGLSLTVALTLALGIGANAAIFSVVRGVLLKPLVNRDEDRLIYIRQSAPGLKAENTAFSVPEIQDLRSGLKTVSAIGDFSTIGFTMVGLGEPRVVRAGVVGGSYFDVMGLRPVLGRLLNAGDDGPNAAGAAVLTYRFWTTALKSDPTVIGKTIRLGTRSATIVGVLEPSVPYPSETELIANVVCSPHHLSATMVTGREHRMTELFGRLAPGADLESARAEIQAVHKSIVTSHPETYKPSADFRINAVRLRDQITSRARTVLLVLLAASGLIFVIACSNVANLILARSVRRESELAVRAALGAGTGALRRTLLAESLLLCVTGAVLGVLIARPMVDVLAHYAARFSVRALDMTLDSSLLWVGVALAIAAALLLAFVPRLPSADSTPTRLPRWGPRNASHGFGLSNGGVRITGSTTRRLQAFAVIQIAASFVLLAGAAMLLKTLLTLQATSPGFNTSVLAVNVPVPSFGRTPEQVRGIYREIQRRLAEVPGVERVAVGGSVPWRDAGNFGPGFVFSVEGRTQRPGEEDSRGKFRSVSPGFFAALGIPILAGRDFTDADRSGAERVVIIGQTLAERIFPGQDPINRHLMWTDSVMRFIGISTEPRRIVGVVADVSDEQIEPTAAMLVYHPVEQEIGGGRLFVHARTDPYALVPTITRIVRDMSTDTPVERASTLEDVRAEVLAPNRLNTIVFGGFAAVALAISVVGVAGVLAFSVSGRTREFGIRLAVGSQPRHLLTGVLTEGMVMAAFGIVAGVTGGYALAKIVASFVQDVQLPGLLPVIGSAAVLLVAAIVASVLPAARAARVDVMQALRSE
ncbi:MAG: multidrug ABC transporter substrate-binding protein [Acidobacteria bacterium 13_1_40CM_4_65_8]|nr:MAG: multidrug ABC transporter substrate-binding protein [Acidobacteria bacterium 13_1_40CM_4_65_8]